MKEKNKPERNEQENKKAKNCILPFFIPMEGCSHRCIFCDQGAISGQVQGPLAQDICRAVESCVSDKTCQVAFYGGSFSALPRQRQKEYLLPLQPYLASGRISSLRISTRPDCLDEDELVFLAGLGVDTIELGIQSFSDRVLAACGRGYDSRTATKGAALVKAKGFCLGLQLMTGLPLDDAATSLFSAQEAADLEPDMVRIYPTLVLAGTPLAELYATGHYQPQSLIQAVELCRDMVLIFDRSHIPVIRMGINPSPQVEAALVAGPYDPAFGHLVRCAIKKEQLCLAIEQAGFLPRHIYAPKSQLPQLFGQNQSNKLWLAKKLGFMPAFHADDSLSDQAVAVADGQQRFVLSYDRFLHPDEKIFS